MNTVIYMVRHAESPFMEGAERTRGLSASGQQKIQQVTELLAGEGVNAVYSSPYARAVLSVEPLAEKLGLQVLVREDLRERRLSGYDYVIADEEFMPAIQKCFADRLFKLPGGESMQMCQDRAVPVLLDILEQHEGGRVAVGTHGNVMTLMIRYFDAKYGWNFFRRTSMPDVYKLEFAGRKLLEVTRMWKEE